MKKLLLLSAFALILFGACKRQKDDLDDTPKNDQPLKVEHGIPMGSKSEQVIGPEGGTLELSDGSLRIDIPAGALDVPTNISVQPITSTLAKFGIGQAYRLGPENIKFKKDVELTIVYSDTLDTNGRNPDLFSLAYQDDKGYWHYVKKPSLSRQRNSVSVNTRHFSDWVVMSVISVTIHGEQWLSANETVDLSVDFAFPPTGSDDDLLRPWIVSKNIGGWKAVTGTIFNAEQTLCTYKAPPSIATETNAEITVTLNDIDLKEYNPNIPRDFTLGFDLWLLPDEYVHYKINGDPISGTRYYAIRSPNMMSLSSQGDKISLEMVKYGSGTNFPFGTLGVAGQSIIQLHYIPTRVYTSRYLGCDNKLHNTIGNLVITRDDDKVGGIIEGKFSGQLFDMSYCTRPETVTVEGKFRLRIKVIGN
ncbi:MAG: hypothetical protein ACN6PI_06150 [Sphingobacterium siyangense]|uniref:hypothetical protein n=1 Tax=Sphingobacterium siyangense TaxID=459529 RepID=UPI003DA658A1